MADRRTPSTRRWRCRLGIHSYGTLWYNVAPRTGGGPLHIVEKCQHCGWTKLTRNRVA